MRAVAGRVVEFVRRLFVLYYSYLAIVLTAIVPNSYRNKKRILGEVALITGAGGDIGRQLALRLADFGVRLVLWDVNVKTNEETACLVRLRVPGIEVHTYICDVSVRDAVYAVAARVKDEVGAVTILVNNAGVATAKRFLDIADERIAKVFNTNVFSHFWTCKAFLPDMLELNYGHVVAVSSLSGVLGVPRLTEYASSKQAVVGFMEALKLELLSDGFEGIKTTLVLPFLTKTGLFSGRYRGVLPRLDATYIAEEIVTAMLLDKEVLVLPKAIRGMLFLKPITSGSVMLQTNDLLGDRDFFLSMKVRS